MGFDFFSTYDRFLSSSTVGNWRDRLNARYEAIIGANRPIFDGASVLDIASHDGRWTFAAIEAGAKHVTGIEMRADLVDVARQNMETFPVTQDRYRFEQGDVFERPNVFRERFDVVLCLGFFYHTARQIELLEMIRQNGARNLILDTALVTLPDSLCEIRSEAVSHPAAGHSETGVYNGRILVSVPTAQAVSGMLHHFGYSVEVIDWGNLIDRYKLTPQPDKPLGPQNPVVDYARGERGTFVATLSQ